MPKAEGTCKRSLQAVRLNAVLGLLFRATVLPLKGAPLHMLTKAQNGSYDKRRYGYAAEHEKAEPVGFKAAPRSDHVEGRAQHVGKA